MDISQSEHEDLDFLNKDKKFDLFAENVVLEDFIEFNDCLDCRYFNESTFATKYANTNDLLFLNSNVQSLAAKFTNICSFFDHMNNSNCLPDIFSLQEIWKIQPDFSHLFFGDYQPFFSTGVVSKMIGSREESKVAAVFVFSR